MTPKTSSTPRTPRRSPRTADQSTQDIPSTNDSNKVNKATSRNSNHRAKRKLHKTPTKRQRKAKALAAHLHAQELSLSPDIEMTDEMALETEVVNFNGERLVADAMALEPKEDQTSQEMNENDRKLSGLTLATDKTKSDDDQKPLQFFRRIYILYDGDPNEEQARQSRVLLDTGSLHSLTFACHMRDRKIQYVPFKKPRYLRSVEQRAFRILGKREILIKYRGRQVVHAVDIYVLEDPPDDLEPSFDVLLGREHLIPANAVQVNTDVVGDAYQVAN